MSEQKTESGRVVAIRVFTDRASITRRREIELDGAAIGPVVFAPVPDGIELETVQAEAKIVSGDRSSTVRVVSVAAGLEYGEVTSGRQLELDKKIETLTRALGALEDEDEVDRMGRERVAAYASIATQKLSYEWLDQSPSFDKWATAFDQLQKATSKLVSAQAERRARRAELRQQLTHAERDRAKAGRPSPLGHHISVSLDLPKDARGNLVVEVSYLDTRARWVPAYDLRHDSSGDKEKATLTAIALVSQSSSEDWSEVSLIATTARPRLSEPPPELAPLTVSGMAGPTDQRIVSNSQAEVKLEGAVGEAAAAGAPAATVEFPARGKVSIPSTGRAVRVELFEVELPARSRLEIAPRERPVALLVAELENLSGRVLLAGRVNIFRGPNYSGQSLLPFVGARERFRLPLGTDAGLRVVRTVKAEPEKKAMITGAVSYTYDVRTTIENVSGSAIEVLLRDRVPVSFTEEATVKILELEKPTEVEDNTGLTKLNLSIPARTRREVHTSVRITAPRGFSLVPPKVV